MRVREYGPGLVAVQYARRLKSGELDVEGIRALRERSVEEMAHTDIAQARSFFAEKLKEQSGSAEEPAEQDEASASANH